MNKNVKTILGEVKAYLIITIGLLIYVMGWQIFVLPNGMLGGGVSGMGAILFYAFGIPISWSFLLINLVLLIIALKVLGKGFGLKTVYAIIATSVFFDIVPAWLPQVFIQEVAISNGKLLCAIFGGVCSGLGVGICFSQGGSTGGTDIIALMITKYRNISPGRIILLIDVVTIASFLLLPAKEIVDSTGAVTGVESIGQRFATILYGYLLIGACSYTIDLFLAGSRQSLQVFIFSKKYAEIADAIISDVKRGVTLIDAQGWYTKERSKIVMVIVRKTDINMVYRVVKSIDRDAFMSVDSVTGVYGKGFDQIKK